MALTGSNIATQNLVEAAITATGTSAIGKLKDTPAIVHAFGTTTSGNVSGTVTVYGNTTEDTTYGVSLGTITLSAGASPQIGKLAVTEAWPFIYCTWASLTGTDAALTVRLAQ